MYHKLQTITQKNTLNCKGKLILLEKPIVMGIINITPDSFFEGSRKNNIDEGLQQAEKMLKEGATILDIGGHSTRPGATDVSMDEELNRTIPFIEKLSNNFPEAILSIDTFRSTVAKNAIDAGAHIINDVAAGDDDEWMFETVASLKVPYIIMHKKGTYSDMHKNPSYDNVVLEVINYLAQKVKTLNQLGVFDIVIDPGFGFGKTFAHNYELMHHLNDFQILGLPVLTGVSRKKMVQHITGTDASGALNGTTVLHTMALLNGSKILRAHDVKEAIECIKLVNAVYGNI